MSDLRELIADGFTVVRLPIWNQHAYLVVQPDHSSALLFDVGAGIGGGQPIPMTVAECAEASAWEPVL